MNIKNRFSIAAVVLVGIALGFFILRMEPATVSSEEHEAQSDQEEEGLMAKGPHGGRLLTQDGFEVEITIYERGVPPQFRVYAYEQGKPLSPEQVQLTIELHRLGGRIDRIQFQKEGDYLRGDRVIEEPHSFDVKISALYQGKSYHWDYSQVEGRVRLSPEVLQGAGIDVREAGPARIKTRLELPGEIGFDQNRVAHVVPRVGGVVTEVRKNRSDPVKKGEVLAVLESRELASLKSQFAQALKRLDFAHATFAREARLWREKISAEQDFLASRKEAAEAEIAVEAAAQSLRALGLDETDLRTIARGTGQALARYELKAPLDGVVIEKHLTLGEAVKEDAAIFTIADLSTVWGEITVYAKDLNLVKLGQQVAVKSKALGLEASGTVSYLGSLVGEETRAAQAHVHIPNPEGRWRPGLFVTVEVIQEEVMVPVAVAAEAIQTYRDSSVVFVQYGDLFEVRPLDLGRTDGQWVEVVKGLSAGERYAATNSFVLKAELGKSGATHDH